METREKYTIVPNIVETYDESALIQESNERSLFSNVKANIRKYKEEIIAVPTLTFVIAISTYLIVIDVFHILLITILITFASTLLIQRLLNFLLFSLLNQFQKKPKHCF